MMGVLCLYTNGWATLLSPDGHPKDFPGFKHYNKMEVSITVGGLKLKVSCEIYSKSVFVRGHYKVINGKWVYVKPYYRKK